MTSARCQMIADPALDAGNSEINGARAYKGSSTPASLPFSRNNAAPAMAAETGVPRGLSMAADCSNSHGAPRTHSAAA